MPTHTLDCVKAIGETGLDKLRGATIERQTELLIHHIALSEELHKPLCIAHSEGHSLKS